MSQEWLKQLAELSNEKDKRKHAQRPKQAPRPVSRPAASGGRSLIGAAFGHFFRWLFLFALAEAVAMFIVGDQENLTGEPWGYIFHYVVWYVLTQPILPAEAYAALQDWFGLTAADFSAFYERIDPFIQEHQDALVFWVPVAAALAVTLFFLPAINAARRRSPIRFLVWLANWVVVFLSKPWGGGVVILWLAAFVFSFVGGGGRRAPRQPQPEAANQPPRPAGQPQKQKQKAGRPAPPAATPARESAVQRAVQSVVALRREPTVSRRDGGGSWIRAR